MSLASQATLLLLHNKIFNKLGNIIKKHAHCICAIYLDRFHIFQSCRNASSDFLYITFAKVTTERLYSE